MSLAELSFLSPKIKVLSATVLLLTGTGCAAFFPAEQSESTTTTNVVDSFKLPADLSLHAFPLIPADSISAIVDPSLSSPRGEWVEAEPVFGNQFVPTDRQENVSSEDEAENEYVVVQPDSPYGKYLPPPSFDTDKPKESAKSLTSTPASMSAPSSSTANLSHLPGSQGTSRIQPKLDTYSGIDDPDLAKTSVELSPLQRWNNVFESSPPLNDLTKSQKEWLTRKSRLAESESTAWETTQKLGTTQLVLPTDRFVPNQINRMNLQNRLGPSPLVIPNNRLLPLAPTPD